MTITPGRLVALLTPLIFAPLAGSISVLAARYLPGVNIDQGSLQAIFIAGATIAFGKAALWLKGWQDWEKREADASSDVVDLPDAHPGSGFDEEPVAAQDAAAEEEPVAAQDAAAQEEPVAAQDAAAEEDGFEEDPVDGDGLDFDDGDLDDLLASPVAAGDQG
jgi:hypothetical protein